MRKKVALKTLTTLLLTTLGFIVFGQKPITLEDIMTKGTFQTKSVPGFNFLNDGRHYTKTEGNAILIFDILTGEKTETIVEGSSLKDKEGFSGNIYSYSFSEDEQSLLLEENIESIYRHSKKLMFTYIPEQMEIFLNFLTKDKSAMHRFLQMVKRLHLCLKTIFTSKIWPKTKSPQ